MTPEFESSAVDGDDGAVLQFEVAIVAIRRAIAVTASQSRASTAPSTPLTALRSSASCGGAGVVRASMETDSTWSSKSPPVPVENSPRAGANTFDECAPSRWSSSVTIAPAIGPCGPGTVLPTFATFISSNTAPRMFSLR